MKRLNRFWCESRVSLSCNNSAISSGGSSIYLQVLTRKIHAKCQDTDSAENLIFASRNKILCIEDVAIIAVNTSYASIFVFCFVLYTVSAV